jgi:nucleoid-associated protein YgaU
MPPEAESQDYVVQTDDTLSRLADKFYDDPLLYPAIVAATNARVAEDDSYTFISDPDVIDVGQKLRIPTLAEAELLLAGDEE